MTDKKVSINGYTTISTELGKGIPLLFAHGYSLNRSMWQPQLEGLTSVARVIALDLRGHGDAEPAAPPYSMDLFADDLNALLEALSIQQRIVLCGLSMGGYITLAFFRKYASRLAGLILTATRSGADSPEGRLNRDKAIDTVKEKGVTAIVDSMLPKILAPNSYEKKPELVALVRSIMESTSVDGIVGALSAMKERPDSTPDLVQIHVPTLIIHGADDQLIPIQEAQAMQAAITGSTLEIIPDAGHLLNLEQPVTFNHAIRRFLASLP